MEIEEEENINYLNDDEKEIRRFMMNTQIDIFQDNNNYCIRPQNVIPFDNSYEHQIIQNNSSNILSSSSNLIYYTLGNNLDNIHSSKKKLRKFFYNTKQNKIKNKSQEELGIENKNIVDKIVKNKVGNDNRYLILDMMINNEDFDMQMRENTVFRERIFNNPFFELHPKANEIIEKYGHLLY